jgi:hypothetical protein
MIRARTTLLAIAWLALPAAPLPAQVIQRDLPVVDGSVTDIEISGNTLYLCGGFSRIGPGSATFARCNLTSGVLTPGLPAFFGGSVGAIAADGAGGWFIGGGFSHVGGLARSNLVHINADLSVSPWNPGASGGVGAIAVRGNTVYVGGYSLAAVGGQPRTCIAAIDATTGAVTPWNPNIDGHVFALAADDTTVYAGGDFFTVGGLNRRNLAAIGATSGIATSWNPSPGYYVTSLVLSPPLIYVGGTFTSIGGLPRNRIAAVPLDSSTPTAWNPNADNQVSALALSGSTLYVGGTFTTIGGQARNRIAAIDAGTGNATAWNPGADAHVMSLAVSGSTVYAGGSFQNVGGASRPCLAAIDAGTGTATPFRPAPNGAVEELLIDGEGVLAGGTFMMWGGKDRNTLAAIDLTTMTVTDWNPAPGGGGVGDIAVSGSTVYLVGGFTSVGFQTRAGIAAVDAQTGLATPWNPHPDGWTDEMNVYHPPYIRKIEVGDDVFVVGRFRGFSGQTRWHIAALDPSSGAPTSWNVGVAGGSEGRGVLAVNGDMAYASWFLAPSLDAFLTGTGGGAYALGSNGMVESLELAGPTLYMGGAFTQMAGQPRSHVCAVNASDGTLLGWDPNPDGGVYAIAQAGSLVYLGGAFRNIGGQPLAFLAAVDASTGALDPGWNLALNDYVEVIRTTGTWNYFGGRFLRFGNEWHRGLAATFAGGTVVVPAPPQRPGTLAIETVAPHPLRRVARVRFVLARSGPASLEILDVAGRRVRSVFEHRRLEAGPHDVDLARGSLAGGLYLLVLRSSSEAAVRKLVVLP